MSLFCLIHHRITIDGYTLSLYAQKELQKPSQSHSYYHASMHISKTKGNTTYPLYALRSSIEFDIIEGSRHSDLDYEHD